MTVSVFNSIIPVAGNELLLDVNADRSQALLASIDSKWSRQRMGSEKVTFKTGDLIITRGTLTHTKDGAQRLMRYIRTNADGNFICAIVVNKVNKEVFLTDVFTRADYRRQGIASKLLDEVLIDFSEIKVDSKMTVLGRAFFLRSPQQDSELKAQQS